MSRTGVLYLAETMMTEAEQWRSRLQREWWRRPIERNRRLTGAWLSWICASRVRSHILYRTASTRECAWMLGRVRRVLQRMGPASGEPLETAMALLLWVGRVDLDQPRARASYITWIGADRYPAPDDLPRPYRPQPERSSPWYSTVWGFIRRA